MNNDKLIRESYNKVIGLLLLIMALMVVIILFLMRIVSDLNEDITLYPIEVIIAFILAGAAGVTGISFIFLEE